MRTSKLRFKWNFLNGLLFQPTVAWDVFKMDMRYLSLKGLQVGPVRASLSWFRLRVASFCPILCFVVFSALNVTILELAPDAA